VIVQVQRIEDQVQRNSSEQVQSRCRGSAEVIVQMQSAEQVQSRCRAGAEIVQRWYRDGAEMVQTWCRAEAEVQVQRCKVVLISRGAEVQSC